MKSEKDAKEKKMSRFKQEKRNVADIKRRWKEIYIRQEKEKKKKNAPKNLIRTLG